MFSYLLWDGGLEPILPVRLAPARAAIDALSLSGLEPRTVRLTPAEETTETSPIDMDGAPRCEPIQN